MAFETVPMPTVHGILVHYTGPDFFDNLVDAQPTGLDLLTTLDQVMRCYPISGFQYSGCEIIAWTTDDWTAQVIAKLLNDNEELLQKKR